MCRIIKKDLFHAVAGKIRAITAFSALLTAMSQPSGAQAPDCSPSVSLPHQERNRPSNVPLLHQERGDRPEEASLPKDAHVPVRELGDTVAVVPWNYKNSRDAAVQSAHEVCSQLLLGSGFNVFLIRSAAGAMPPPMSGMSGSKREESAFSHLLGMGHNIVTQDAPNKTNPVFVLPTLEEMLAIGERLHPHYVLAGRAQWRSRNVWIGVSNRIKSICTVDLKIVDMSSRRLVLDAHGIEGDSTESKNLYNSFTNLMALNPLPLVMPGSIGPYEQRAVTVAVARAMQPWLKTERIRTALAQAEQSHAEAGTGLPITRFSSLLSASMSDFQAHLHVTTPNGKGPDVGDKELNRLFALHDITLQYKEPNQLCLSASSPKEGTETLVINEDQRSLTVGEGRRITQHDFADSPAKRSFLFELCGVLTPGIFDTMRARFVKQQTVEGISTLVYDLTYWGLDDGPYHRIWIDPARRHIVRRERFDAAGKLKNIVLYKQPTQIAPNLWVPGSIEFQNSGSQSVATIKLTNPQANLGIPASAFALPVP